jgi:hypothetical protein
MLQAKRPHEKVFTEWCSSNDYDTIQRNIKIIENYGWLWNLKEDHSKASREQILLNRLRMAEMRLKRLLECQK